MYLSQGMTRSELYFKKINPALCRMISDGGRERMGAEEVVRK
jgi:hypothetical protein